jgi:hypothetical protein
METDQQASEAEAHSETPQAPTQPPITLAEHEMACPVCGHAMPDLKGGKATICAVCGFKDSCCF